MKPGDQVEVDIERMSLHGGAVARHQGFVLFVEYAAPGERLLVEITEVKKNHGFAKIVNALKEAPERQAPHCKVFGRCGGCGWQHLTLESQQKWKSQLLKETLEKAWPDSFAFLPLQSDNSHPFRYRNRIQLKKNGSAVGYFEKGSHTLVAIDDCPLAEAALLPAFKTLQNQKPVAPNETWELCLNASGVAEIRPVEAYVQHFSQVNRFVNQQLVQFVLEWASTNPFEKFWDLYCGAGNFSIPLAEKFTKSSGVGVDLSELNLLKARVLCTERSWSPKRLEFYRSDVGAFLKRRFPGRNSLVVVDPPRAGLEESVLETLAFSEASKILYISCNPMSLARDLDRLRALRPHQWILSRAVGFDMFPQTEHVETLVELVQLL